MCFQAMDFILTSLLALSVIFGYLTIEIYKYNGIYMEEGNINEGA